MLILEEILLFYHSKGYVRVSRGDLKAYLYGMPDMNNSKYYTLLYKLQALCGCYGMVLQFNWDELSKNDLISDKTKKKLRRS